MPAIATDRPDKKDPRKAFRARGDRWKERRGGRFQHRQCSTPGCLATANWLIAFSPFERGVVRYACDGCKAKKYAKLDEVQL